MSFKNVLIVFTLIITQSSLVLADQAEVVRPDSVFTPKGFDTNDNAQVILSGSLSNLCQKIAPSKFEVDVGSKKITIENIMIAGSNCRDDHMMFVPYTSVVNLGNLPEGDYKVLVKNESGKYETRMHLPVTRALIEGSSDELLYAPVEELSFKYKPGARWPLLTLKGIYTNTCLTLKSILYRVKEGNVVEVLPITINSNKDCKAAAKPFRKTVELVDFPAGKVLIHVRTMNGMALNKVITNLDRLAKW